MRNKHALSYTACGDTFDGMINPHFCTCGMLHMNLLKMGVSWMWTHNPGRCSTFLSCAYTALGLAQISWVTDNILICPLVLSKILKINTT